MVTNDVKAFIQAAIKPRGPFMDMIIMFMPLFMEMFQQWMEGCTTAEDRAIDLVVNPRVFQQMRAENDLMRRMRRENDEFRDLPRREQKAIVNDLFLDASDAAAANPELVRAAFRSCHNI